MLKFDVKRKINTLRDILVGKVPDPKAQVEQITIALIYKFMDDMDLDGVQFGGNREFFKEDFEKYAFSQIMQPENSAQQRLNLFAEGIDRMVMNPHLPKLFRDIFRGAYIPYRDPDTLNMFMKEIAEFTYSNSEDLGNAFEDLLSIMGSQGDAGQFRTPRHIIDMMVEITAPQKNETVLDPACGTAGFLISAFKYIEEHNRDQQGISTLSADDRNRITANFAGYDISPDMVRLSRVNMYLHHFTKPQISEYDTLTSLDKWDDTYDVIFANPPFMTPKGGVIIPHKRYRVEAKRSEVLFVDYIAEHLNPTGRAAVIVPEGIVFQTANAYKQLRQYLVDGGLLYAVISLPAGVFNPYSGVKTSILLMNKTLAKTRDDILFVKLNNDGLDLGAQRREIKQNDIPDVINVVKDYIAGKDVSPHPLAVVTKKTIIAGQDYTLIGERYIEREQGEQRYPFVSLGDTSLFNIESGGTPSSEVAEYWNGSIKWATLVDLPADNRVTILTDTQRHITELGLSNSSAKLLPVDTILVSTRATIGRIAIAKCETATNQGFKNVIILDKTKVMSKYVAYILEKLIPQMVAMASGGTFKEISKANISKLQIPLPQLSVQEEIVAEIEGYQKIIDGARQVVDNYKPYIKVDSSWQMEKVGDVVEFVSGVTLSIGETENPDGIPIITIADVTEDGYIQTNDIRKVRTDKNTNVLQKGDLLFNWRNGSKHLVGKTALFNLEGQYIFASFLLGLRPNNDLILSDFLWILLNQYRVEGKYMQFMRQNVNGLFNKEELKDVEIPLPSIEVQRRIIAYIHEEMTIIEQNKRLIEIFEQKIKNKISEVWGE